MDRRPRVVPAVALLLSASLLAGCAFPSAKDQDAGPNSGQRRQPPCWTTTSLTWTEHGLYRTLQGRADFPADSFHNATGVMMANGTIPDRFLGLNPRLFEFVAASGLVVGVAWTHETGAHPWARFDAVTGGPMLDDVVDDLFVASDQREPFKAALRTGLTDIPSELQIRVPSREAWSPVPIPFVRNVPVVPGTWEADQNRSESLVISLPYWWGVAAVGPSAYQDITVDAADHVILLDVYRLNVGDGELRTLATQVFSGASLPPPTLIGFDTVASSQCE